MRSRSMVAARPSQDNYFRPSGAQSCLCFGTIFEILIFFPPVTLAEISSPAEEWRRSGQFGYPITSHAEVSTSRMRENPHAFLFHRCSFNVSTTSAAIPSTVHHTPAGAHDKQGDMFPFWNISFSTLSRQTSHILNFHGCERSLVRETAAAAAINKLLRSDSVQRVMSVLSMTAY
jgi:hypothetical protein